MITTTRPVPTGYIRSYVVELEAGDETILGEIVESVHRWDDHNTLVIMTSGARSYFRQGDSTILIRE